MKRTRVLSAAFVLIAVGAATQVQAQGRGRGRGREKGEVQNQQQVPQEEQDRRAKEEQERAEQYKRHLDQQVVVVQRQAAQIDARKRAAQLRAQQEYAEQLRQQQARVQVQRDYRRDPYVSTPHTYRYVISGDTRQTNQYGADALRQAVNSGYEQGYRAGQADRQDHWRSNYQSAPAYQDANYGYMGNYVAQSDYNYYFRQGFQRGYQDGYAAQLRYGTNTNGTTSILGSVLSSILGLVPIR